MTLLDLYSNYLEDFAKQHNDEIRSVLKNYKTIKQKDDKDEEDNAYDYIPPHHIRDKSNDPAQTPIFKQFITGFYDRFLGAFENEIYAKLRGHFEKVNGKTLAEINKLKVEFWPNILSKNYIIDKLSFGLTVELIDQTIFNGKKRKKHSVFINKYEPNYIEILELRQCNYCDDFISVIYDFENKIFRPSDYFMDSGRECPIIAKEKKDKFIYKFDLSVPSKKLVFINDIRQVFDVEKEGDLSISINSAYGKKVLCEEYVKNGMAYFCVGNTSPSIYQHKIKNQIIIDPDNVKLKWDENTDEIKNIQEYSNKGYICTDLWAVCMADYDDFVKRCKQKDINIKDLSIVVVDIPKDKIKVKYNFEKYLIEIKS